MPVLDCRLSTAGTRVLLKGKRLTSSGRREREEGRGMVSKTGRERRCDAKLSSMKIVLSIDVTFQK